MAFAAKLPGRCKRCRGAIQPGERIVKDDKRRGYVHEVCPAQPVQLVFSMPEPGAKPASPAQLELLENLLEERTPSAALAEHFPDNLSDLKSNQAGAIIDEMFNMPRGIQADVPGPDQVPAGRYALEDGPALQLVKVFRDGDRVRVFDDDNREHEYHAGAILRRIVRIGAAEAATRYGQLRGRCWRCGRKLEDKVSVELAMGPVCGEHIYPKPVWKIKVRAARDEIRERGEDPDAPAEHSAVGQEVTI
jgi:hypothetical protein